MSKPAVNPFTLDDCLLTLGADDYEAHVSGVEFVPTSQTLRWKGLSPTSIHTRQTKAEWSARIAFAQDWENPASLSNYLLDHAGEEVPATFEPINGGQAFTATLVLAPPPIGGNRDAWAVGEATCGVIGKPVKVA